MLKNSKADWKVHINKFFKHIVHDVEKGVDNVLYKWGNVAVQTKGNRIAITQGSTNIGSFDISQLGTELKDYKDNSIQKYLTDVSNTATMSQEKTNSQETKKMVDTNKVVNNVTGTLKTVAEQIKDSAIVSAKMEAGENILLALRNLVLNKAGFMQRVKFKFAPIALDTVVVLGADVLVAELLPNKKSAKLAVECLNLAMTKEIIHALPITEFTNALTGGEALGKVKELLNTTNND